jgi:hypothetical protein
MERKMKMKVWRLLSDLKSMELDFSEEEEFHIFDEFIGKPMKHTWKTRKLTIVKKGKFQDFPSLGAVVPTFSIRTYHVLGDLIKNDVEYLDAIVMNTEIELKLVNVINVVDAVDYSRSIPTRTLSGIVNGFRKLSFLADKVESQTIFKIPETRIGYVYVSDLFRETVLQSKLKGFEFMEVWDSEFTAEMEQEAQARYQAALRAMELNKGPEFDWAEAVRKIEEGKAVASGEWKMQQDSKGIMQIARYGLEGHYNWSKSDFVPPVILGLKWHEVEKSDI